MKSYETPSYEVEYFTILNEVFTISENPDNEVTTPAGDEPTNDMGII